MSIDTLIAAVRQHAKANYEHDGWDVVVECWDDLELASVLDDGESARPQDEAGAITKVREYLRPFVSVRREHEAEAIAGGRDDIDTWVTAGRQIDHTGYSNHSQNCYESFSRGAECSCGLIDWQGSETEMQELNERTYPHTIEESVTAIQPSGINPRSEDEEIPF